MCAGVIRNAQARHGQRLRFLFLLQFFFFYLFFYIFLLYYLFIPFFLESTESTASNNITARIYTVVVCSRYYIYLCVCECDFLTPQHANARVGHRQQLWQVRKWNINKWNRLISKHITFFIMIYSILIVIIWYIL